MKHEISKKKFCRFRIREKHVMNLLKDYDAQLRDEVAVESVVIIVLVSLLVTLLFFGKLSQRAINPYKISLRGDSSSFSYSFMLYFSYKI